jgi:rod shape-determining protein MreC
MKSLLKFILTFHFFILFLILEALAIFLVIQYNVYQRAGFLNTASSVTGYVYEISSSVTSYLSLKEANEQLIAENAYLHNILKSSYQNDKVEFISVKDSLYTQQYIYTPALVINNSSNKQTNYITINRGRKHGVKPDMGVICPTGVIGVVRNVSDHYSLVISLLNTNLKISAKVKRSGYFGSISWDGGDYQYASLTEIPFHVKVHQGDTIVTSGYSTMFPEGIMLGTIDTFNAGKGNSFYDIRVRLSTDFRSLSNVYVIINLLKEEQLKLEKEAAND